MCASGLTWKQSYHDCHYLNHLYTISYKKTRSQGGSALFLEMYVTTQDKLRNSLPGVLMNPIQRKVRVKII